MQVYIRHRPERVLVWTQILLLLCGTAVFASDGTKNCRLFSKSEPEQKALSMLEPLAHRNFTANTTVGGQNYMYALKVCGDVGGVPGAGAIQVDSKGEKTMVGSYNSTQAIGGTDWVMLIYRNGDKYDNHCSKESRKAIIMIFCKRNVDVGPLKVVLEDRDREQDCFYLFELDSSAVCSPLDSHLSAGSIVLIIGVCLLAVYLVGGFLYQRLVVGAKGMEQMPNYSFWVEVGNLAADGCDFVCRSEKRADPHAYSGVATEPSGEETEERDDHLLPM
ncbi:cation-dependent mannose-6-phosphate receptor [Synchiropus picturatus]